MSHFIDLLVELVMFILALVDNGAIECIAVHPCCVPPPWSCVCLLSCFTWLLSCRCVFVLAIALLFGCFIDHCDNKVKMVVLLDRVEVSLPYQPDVMGSSRNTIGICHLGRGLACGQIQMNKGD